MSLPIHYLALHDVLPDIGVFGGFILLLFVVGLVMTPVLLYRGRRREDGSRSAARLPLATILTIAGVFAVAVMKMTIPSMDGLGFALVVIWALYTLLLTAIGVVIWKVAKLPLSR